MLNEDIMIRFIEQCSLWDEEITDRGDLSFCKECERCIAMQEAHDKAVSFQYDRSKYIRING